MQQWDTQRKAVLLDRIRDLIAELAQRESEVPTVLQILAQTETWESHLARARQKQAEFDTYWDEFWSVPETCSRCGVEGTRREITPVPGVPNYGKYCPTCAQLVRATYQRNCVYCWKPYIASAMKKYAELCQDCWREEWPCFAKRVAVQLRRAQEAGVAATLSLKAWFVTLDFFGWRCAFCGGPDLCHGPLRPDRARGWDSLVELPAYLQERQHEKKERQPAHWAAPPSFPTACIRAYHGLSCQLL